MKFSGDDFLKHICEAPLVDLLIIKYALDYEIDKKLSDEILKRGKG